MPWWRRLAIAGSCLLIAVGLVILVVHFVQARQPGQASSGSVSVSQAQLIEQQLQQADALNQQGSTKSALELYDKVLTEDPSNPHALAYAGFLQWNVGSTASVPSLTRVGRAEIETAHPEEPELRPGPPLLRARPREPGSQPCRGGGTVQRLLERRPTGLRAGPGGAAGRRRLQGCRRATADAVQRRDDHHDFKAVALAGRRRRVGMRGRMHRSPRRSWASPR